MHFTGGRFTLLLTPLMAVASYTSISALDSAPTPGINAAEAATSLRHIPDERMLGVFVGNQPSAVRKFEEWLGREVDGVLGYTGHASWADYDGSIGWSIQLWSVLDRKVLWSIPLIPKGARLAAAAAGEYDIHYRNAARKLAKSRPQDPVIYVRTGWEFNGDWFPWSAQDKPLDFIGAFRRFVTIFRSESPRFRFEWNVNIGDVGMDPESAYPGDGYVDIIGMDFYWNTEWDPQNPIDAFNSMVERKWGLKWHQDFAARRNKPTAYSEWGIMSNDGTLYIQKVQSWFASHKVVYQTYWDSDAAFKGTLSNGQYPASSTAYKDAFGQP